MSLGLQGMINSVSSYIAASGAFARSTGHEPKNAPGNGLSAAVWVERITPLPGGSGLASTTVLVVLNVRVYTNMLADPPDAIDPALTAATDTLMTAFSGDFDLGQQVRNVDLLGAVSDGLSAQAGYLEQDGKLFRVMTITLPLIVNDLYNQVA
jgi:hypothetical protein